MEHRASVALLASVTLALGAGCGAVGGHDPVATSVLEPHAVVTPPGPAYVAQALAVDSRTGRVTVDGSGVGLGRVDEVDWLPDGRLLVQRAASRSDRRGGVTGDRAQLVDPTTGAVLREVPGDLGGDWGVTPDALTFRSGERLVVYSPDLTGRRVIALDGSAVDTDQDEGSEAEFSIASTAYTLADVTWVQWGVNSEDDTRTDHGVLRIEDDKPVEVLRDRPVVSLVPSSDGAALLVLMQDNGEDESCGGCVVEQEVVELDPRTGEVAAAYGMPDDYERGWRVEALDKVGQQVVARFAVGEAESPGDPGVTRQTWVYDDDGWSHLAELDGSRTRWQDGGRLTWTQLQTRRDEGEGAAFRLEWVPDEGATEVLVDGAADCPRNDGRSAVPVGAPLCPLVAAPGSLLPPR